MVQCISHCAEQGNKAKPSSFGIGSPDQASTWLGETYETHIALRRPARATSVYNVREIALPWQQYGALVHCEVLQLAGRCLALEAGQEQGDSNLQAAPLCRPRQRTTATDLTVVGVAGGRAGARSLAGATLF